ncbi:MULTISPECIES: MFS transporter [Acetobacteraceae]|uniref:MFS permease n=1 Tax=Parasaccharibacter apium TaxID=1510841 RepID=A0A7U7J1M5_9PROT|nr:MULTISPECIES: MFS transporter [Acetobacteraceae]MCL1562090.1 MFS transporter [Parasaccharibacter sp. TMW 2.1886]MCQ0041580.1 MFS transporter [Bombella sp.]MUG79130.1 MFS transporter [Bombella sp. ESL0380]MUH02447.1 MFS transporter [Bombella sp. ESL0387]QGT74833.1 MFS transporter [Bombella sp. ESL0368]
MEQTETVTGPRLTPPHGVAPAIAALMLGTFTIGTGEFGMMGILPAFSHALDISIGQASAVISAYALGVVVGAPIMAIAGARLPRRTVLLLLLSLFCIGNIGTILFTSLLPIEVMRFITGLPHGAYFGIAALTGASMVERARRGRAISMVLSGIMISTVIGAPLSTFLSQYVPWEVIYGALSVLGLICVAGVAFFIPADRPQNNINARSELSAFRNPHVLLTLLTGAIGFGGMFAVYTFLTSGLGQVTHLSPWMVTLYQVIWGCGMVAGNAFGGAMIDRNLNRTTIFSLIASVVFMLAFWLLLPSSTAMLVVCFFLPAATIILSPAMQARLMDVAGDAQTLAASLNHSAFNIANALGASLGAMLVEHGLGISAVGWGGAILSASGLLIYLVTLQVARLHKP